VTSEVSPWTWTGLRAVSIVLLPRARPNPQHFALPSTTAQVWSEPAAIDVTPEVRPVGWTGVEEVSDVPSPNCPLSFEPQHFAAPEPIAQACRLPMVTSVAAPMPETATGSKAGDAASDPSWPCEFEPQHLTTDAWTAQEEVDPAATAVTPDPRPETGTGLVDETVVPSPS